MFATIYDSGQVLLILDLGPSGYGSSDSETALGHFLCAQRDLEALIDLSTYMYTVIYLIKLIAYAVYLLGVSSLPSSHIFENARLPRNHLSVY